MKKNLSMLIFFMLIFGLFSIFMGQDVNGDFLNYHLYNAYACLHGRTFYDVAAAGMRTYFNPILDIVNYLIIVLIKKPELIAFVLGTFSGVAAFFLYKTASLLFVHEEPHPRKIYLILSVLIGLTGSTCISQVGTTMNDVQSAVWVMAAVFFAVKALLQTELSKQYVNFAIAGLLIGIATGLKLTCMPYWIGLMIATGLSQAFNKKNSYSILLILLVGSLGFLLVNGWWMWELEKHFNSPMFPFFNKVFHSSFYLDENLRDARFGVHGLIAALVLPFQLMIKNHLVSEPDFSLADWRMAVLLSFAALYFICRLLKTDCKALSRPWQFLLAFYFAAYFCWAFEFGIFRYAIPLLMLSGLLIVCFYERIHFFVLFKYDVLFMVFGAILISTWYPSFSRQPFSNEFISLNEVPSVPKNSLLVLANVNQSFVVAFFPEQVRLLNPWFPSPTELNQNALAAETILKHQGPLYILMDQNVMGPGEQIAAYYHYKIADTCQVLNSNFTWKSPMYLCPLLRIKALDKK